jgi:three-Cys-motif partner protein
MVGYDPDLDDIGPWSEVKLEILKKYAEAYTTILTKQKNIKAFYYIDAFSGGGLHRSRESGEIVHGSPLNALTLKNQFTGYFFVDLNPSKLDALRDHVCEMGFEQKVKLFHGDCNEVLMKEVFPRISYESRQRALCLLDPYAMHYDWKLVEAAGKSGAIEIFFNFPIMDINMNVLHDNPQTRLPSQRDRMMRFWGDDTWNLVYSDQNLFKFEEKVEDANRRIVSAYMDRLKKIAGFKYVAGPLAMKNSSNAIVYYLLFASPKSTGAKIVDEIMNKFRV